MFLQKILIQNSNVEIKSLKLRYIKKLLFKIKTSSYYFIHDGKIFFLDNEDL